MKSFPISFTSILLPGLIPHMYISFISTPSAWNEQFVYQILNVFNASWNGVVVLYANKYGKEATRRN